MLIVSIPEEGDGEIIYDIRWQFPELLGYKPSDPQYKLLRELWEKARREEKHE